MPDAPGDPIAYTALQPGTPVQTNDGHHFATVHAVLVDEKVSVFDGIVVQTAEGTRFVDADFEQHYFTLLEQRHETHPQLRMLAALDLLANNADRKGGHVLVDAAGSVWGIDNGLCFHVEPKLLSCDCSQSSCSRSM